MKRDDPALEKPIAGAIRRDAGYFGPGLFGWYHEAHLAGPTPAMPRDTVAVICPPVGPEYTRSHRTLRHLADRLALQGVPTLRFDYEGVGDSAGDDDAPERLAHWRQSIVHAVQHARQVSGRARVCLVGVRLGATLAALEAQAVGADLLVLWNPVVKGRAYARELQAMAMTAGAPPAEGGGGLESAGFRISAETLAQLKALTLEGAAFDAKSQLLLVERDDLGSDPALADRLAAEGIDFTRKAAAGWNAMMADHQFTVVPEAALDTIADWVAGHSAPQKAVAHAPAGARRVLEIGEIEERVTRFGPGDHLFGVIARPRSAATRPAVLLLNAGSIHHVGPHRLYVRLARELAALGHPVLRFDFEGIGDSVLRAPGRENHPYSPTAMADLAAAIEAMRRDPDCTRFVVMGVCSGAYNSFQAGLALEAADIERVILVNPWYFHWQEGLSLDTTTSNHYEDVAAYQRSMRDPSRWKKLLTGGVDVKRLLRVAATHVAKVARGRWAELREMVRPGSASRLSGDLLAIMARKRRIHVILSDGEPAQALLMTEAARTVKRGLRSGAMTLERVRGGDHTFSRFASRSVLVARVREILSKA
jgi:predicted alpha/beta hydrolase